MGDRIGQQLPDSLALLLVSPAEMLAGDANKRTSASSVTWSRSIIRRITGSCITSSSVGSVPLCR